MRPKTNHYKRIWEQYHKASLLPGMHIHHIDGNPHNNDPRNLQACTPKEHWEIHRKQGDPVALNGKFVENANTWTKLSKEEKSVRVQSMIEGIRRIWSNPETRQKLIEKRTGLKRSVNSKNNISAGRGGKPFKVFKNDELIGIWQNLRQCARDLGLSGKAQIWQCLAGKRKSCKGFRFQYE